MRKPTANKEHFFLLSYRLFSRIDLLESHKRKSVRIKARSTHLHSLFFILILLDHIDGLFDVAEDQIAVAIVGLTQVRIECQLL